MSIFVSGACARIFYSSEAYPTRLSVDFARNLKHSSYVSASGLVIPLSVTVGCPTGAFTAVLDALVDPLCEEDVVLGKDWVTSCTLNNVLPQLDLLPVYSSCECLVIYIIWLLIFVVVIIALSGFFLPDLFAPSGSSSSFSRYLSILNLLFYIFFSWVLHLRCTLYASYKQHPLQIIYIIIIRLRNHTLLTEMF